MSRLLPFIALCALAAAVPASTVAKAPPSWAEAEIRAVVANGLLAPDVRSFRPDDLLTQGELAELAATLSSSYVPIPAADPEAPVTVAQLDAMLVRALGLAEPAARFLRAARAAGLSPPARFGTEVVARLLGLRPNHPAGQDELELLPGEPVTRAEAAYSAARVLRFRGWEVGGVAAASLSFELPVLTPWQKQILTVAVRLIGFPYVWGGTGGASAAPGSAGRGFDCSGFVWRVYKLQAYPGGADLAQTLRGRTTYAMSGEVAPGQRIALGKLQPADVVFFGAHGVHSRPAEVGHAGIYVGAGWMIHSSQNGVALSRLDGWYRKRFAWARRPLAEAGLA
jgi:cell wall-associated NlpC family hydrolase